MNRRYESKAELKEAIEDGRVIKVSTVKNGDCMLLFPSYNPANIKFICVVSVVNYVVQGVIK